MSRAGDDPLLEIRVVGDWAQFDAEAKQRESQLAGRDFTFSIEGRFARTAQPQMGGPGQYSLPPPAQFALPSPETATRFGGGGFGGFTPPSIQQAVDSFAQAFTRLLPGVIQAMSQRLLPAPGAAATPFSPMVPYTGGLPAGVGGPRLMPRDPTIFEAEWEPTTTLATRRELVRRPGYVRPEVPWEEAEWVNAPSFTRMVPGAAQAMGQRRLPPPQMGMVPYAYPSQMGGGPEVIEAEWTSIPRPGGEAGLVPPPGMAGPAGTAPGRGPRMWVPTGGPFQGTAGAGAGGGGWFGGGPPFGPGFAAGGPLWGGGGAWGGGGGLARQAGRGFGNLYNRFGNVPTGMYYNVMFGLWDINRTNQALRQMETGMAGAQDIGDLLGIQMQGIQGATSGILSGIGGMALDLIGFGPTQSLNMLQEQQIRYATQSRSRANFRDVKNAQEIRAATLMGSTEVDRARSRQRRELVEEEVNTRTNTINMLLGEKRSQWLLGQLATGHWGNAWEIFSQNEWGREVYAIQDPGQRQALTTEVRSLEGKVTSAKAQEEFEEKERKKDIAMNRFSQHLATDTLMAQLPGTTRRQAEWVGIINRQRQEIAETQRTRPELVWEVKQRQAAELQVFNYQQDLEQRVANVETRADVAGARLRGERRFYTAQRAELIGRAGAALIAAERDPDEQARIRARLGANLYELEQTERFNRQQQMTTVTGTTAAIRLQIDHKPLQAALEQLKTEAATTLAAVPKDNPQLYSALQEQYRVRGELIERQYKENLFQRDFAGRTEEEYTGMLATAYGPGARSKRLQAEVFRISREAEQRAIARQMEDVTDVEGRERERRIGVNRLQAFRAQYLEGFRAVEGSLFRTAFQGAGTSDPNITLKAIEKGIQDLTKRIGTLVAVP